jgi:hypothetical protein
MGNRVSDPFNGKGWCDKSGEYYIVDVPTFRARCEVPNKLAICNVKHPDNVGSMYAEYFTQDEIPRYAAYGGGGGQKYRVLLNLDRNLTGDPEYCTSGDYYFAEYERLGASGSPADYSKIRLGLVAGGVETILKEENVIGETGLTRKLWAAIDEDSFCAAVTNSIQGNVAMVSPGLIADGYYCGFAMSEKDMLIDNFSFFRHYNSNPPVTRDLNCPSCGLCLCEDNVEGGADEPIALPAVLHVCIYPDPEDCLRLDELEPCCFDIIYDWVDESWTHPGDVCCGGFRVRFVCELGGTGAERWKLANVGGCQQSGGDDVARHPVEYTCNATTNDACFKFGPYLIGASDLACDCTSAAFDIMNPTARGSCNYYITVSTNACCPRASC